MAKNCYNFFNKKHCQNIPQSLLFKSTVYYFVNIISVNYELYNNI